MKRVILKSGKDASIERRHPWVFSGAIKKIKNEEGREVKPVEGEMVSVYSNKDKFLGAGHYQDGSIAVRVLSFDIDEIDDQFWIEKLQKAYDYRKSVAIAEGDQFDCYRLIHAEGDSLPGLIIDYYNGHLVVQAHSIGMHQSREKIAEALREIYGEQLQSIYYKSSETLPGKDTFEGVNGYLYGQREDRVICDEYGVKFYVDWEKGQKTGFFIDQRENRKLLGEYSRGKSVLNTFCYTGGFSIAALQQGATFVHSVDSSQKAIDLTDENVALNGYQDQHRSFAMDTFDYFNRSEEEYDVIVLDPPAFAKHHNVRHNAVQGYKRLNAEAMERIKPGGILFTFSCSQAVDRKLFYNTIVAAAIRAGRNIRVLHHLSQPACHPVSIFHPEGEYLKGLVLYVE